MPTAKTSRQHKRPANTPSQSIIPNGHPRHSMHSNFMPSSSLPTVPSLPTAPRAQSLYHAPIQPPTTITAASSSTVSHHSTPSSSSSSSSAASSSYHNSYIATHHHPIGRGTARPRPDSAVLSNITNTSSSGDSPAPLVQQRPCQLDSKDFWALVRNGDVLQYWLPVNLVLKGLPGRKCVPAGHWERLVGMAEEVRVRSGGGEEDEEFTQLVTGWCGVDEPLGGGGW